MMGSSCMQPRDVESQSRHCQNSISGTMPHSRREEPALLVKPGVSVISQSSLLRQPIPHPASPHGRQPDPRCWLEAELNQGRADRTVGVVAGRR
jgi:hypothetical protein